MGRLLVVSNRLPVTVSHGPEGPLLAPSAGGVATGLWPIHQREASRWIGWPGALPELDAAQRAEVVRELEAQRLGAVELSGDEVRRYYEGYSNGVLWPLFHYLTAQLPLEVADFDAYEAVNERFAEAVAAEYRPGDLVWIHDYQLLLVPELLRKRIPDACIGFFLHIPFPSSEIFRALPQRELILAGMLGADVVGFHTAAYARHFASSVLRVFGVPTRVDRLLFAGREIRLGVFPMGIDAASFAAVASKPEIAAEGEQLRGGMRLIVGVDRLDYTKGIPRRLLAYERLLERHPELRGRVRFVQVAVPSRANVSAYQEFRSQSDELIGRINGRFATPQWTPVHWMYRSLSREEVVALYRAADVMVVTPLRDGMNLVAKEFVASRVDEDGVLVLSEYAGAASELGECISINPYDLDGMAAAYQRALTLPAAERRERMRALRQRVFDWDVQRWVCEFRGALEESASASATPLAPTPPARVRELVRSLERQPLTLLLDYDGTLVPLERTPERAVPDAQLLALLEALAARPRTHVHVVSGRSADAMEQWLGDLPIALHAEHGLASRWSPDGKWELRETADTSWREPVERILEEFAARTPGAFVERKAASLAWHYRAASCEFGTRQANDLLIHLSEVLSNLPVEIVAGSKVIEVRPHGVSKARVAADVARRAPPGSTLVAIGDDRTDEDLFAGLPEDAVTFHVGAQTTRAGFRLASVAAVRSLLGALLPRTD